MIQIRECEVKDTDAIYKLNCEEMGYQYPLEETKKKLEKLIQSKENKIYVATEDNNVIGYIHAVDYDVIYSPLMKNIMGIAVATAYKRRGIGSALMSAVENWAEETGASGVRLVSGETRTGAHEFYRNVGYSYKKQQLNFQKLF